jgi:hypothetical protein
MTTTYSHSDAVRRRRDQCELGDNALRLAALKLLHSSSYTTLRRLRCEVTDAVVIVHGILPSYYLKQVAQSIVLRLNGIEGVMNLVEVRGIDSRPCCENEDEAPDYVIETSLLTQPPTNLPHNPLAVEDQS